MFRRHRDERMALSPEVPNRSGARSAEARAAPKSRNSPSRPEENLPHHSEPAGPHALTLIMAPDRYPPKRQKSRWYSDAGSSPLGFAESQP